MMFYGWPVLWLIGSASMCLLFQHKGPLAFYTSYPFMPEPRAGQLSRAVPAWHRGGNYSNSSKCREYSWMAFPLFTFLKISILSSPSKYPLILNVNNKFEWFWFKTFRKRARAFWQHQKLLNTHGFPGLKRYCRFRLNICPYPLR